MVPEPAHMYDTVKTQNYRTAPNSVLYIVSAYTHKVILTTDAIASTFPHAPNFQHPWYEVILRVLTSNRFIDIHMTKYFSDVLKLCVCNFKLRSYNG